MQQQKQRYCRIAFSLVALTILVKETLCSKNYSVVIVGAGAAGTAAAAKLLSHGFRDILVLEAESRHGGRVFTKEFGEGVVEMGAQWCHGKSGNAVYEMVADLEILEEDWPTELIYRSTGNQLKPEEDPELLAAMDSNNYSPKFDGQQKNWNTMDGYVLQYIRKASNFSKNNSEKVRTVLTNAKFLDGYIRSTVGAFNLSEIAADTDYEAKDSINLHWNKVGYKIIFDILTKNYPDSSKAIAFHKSLLTNKEVSKIIWYNTTSGKVVLNTTDGSSYMAQHVIFTPSVGVIKHCHEQLFDPALPKFKQQAISVLGFDAIMKIHMYFKQKWWGENNNLDFLLLWTLNEREKLAHNEYLAWVLDVNGILTTHHNNKVLSAWVVGDKIPEIETMNDKQVYDGICFVLQTFFSRNYNITMPESLLRSKWYTNPHFRGTYSYETPSARALKPSAFTQLSESLNNTDGNLALLFAGEATSPSHFSTVHGAIESGFREATKIIDYYKHKQ